MPELIRTTQEELEERRRRILAELGLSDEELKQKVNTGGLVGAEWSAWATIEEIDYLLDRE